MSVEVFNPATAVTITDKARQHFLRQISLEEKKQSVSGIRLSIKESGCTGYMYVVDVIPEPVENDIEIQLDESHCLFVDPDALSVVKGTEIDLKTEGINQVLSFSNPNVASECGCGESFSISQ